MARADPSLLERASELEVLEGAARAARAGRGRLVVVQGTAGIGKTTMLRAAGAMGAGHGLRVLAARGTQLERSVGFGVARQLVERLAREVLDEPAWPAATRAAVRRATGPLGLGPGPPDADADAGADPRDAAFVAEQALLAAVIELARHAPLALVVDDAQWADEPSLRTLGLVAARLDALPLLVVVAARPSGEPGGAAGTTALLRAAEATLLHPSPLSDAAASTLVRSVVADASAEECSACQAASRGNPLLLRELAAALRGSDGARRSAAVPPSIAHAVDRRLSSLSGAARILAEAVAVFEPRATLTRCAHLVGMAWDDAVAAADELVASAILEPSVELTFVHPVVRTAVHDAIAPARRADLHATAAALLHADGTELDVVASHLLQSPPRGDPDVVGQLGAAARAAVRRGAPEAAIACLRRAVAEPPAAGPERAGLLLALGQAELLTGSMADAEADLRRALEAAGDAAPATRLQAAMALGQLLSVGEGLNEGVALLDAELGRAGPADEALRARVETVLLNLARMDADAGAAAAEREARLRRFVFAGGAATPEQLATVAAAEAQAGASSERTAEVGLRALRRLGGRRDVDALSYGYAARALIAADRLEETTAGLRRELEAARRRGARFSVGFLVAILAEARYRAGALVDAEQLMRVALDPGVGWEIGRSAILSVLARSLVEQGRLDAAGEAIAAMDLDAADAAPSRRYPLIMGLHARGRWRLEAGDADGALSDFEQCATGLEACAEPNPALVEWRSDAAWALLARGEPDRARALADDELTRARAFGAARPIGVALRARAAAGAPAERTALLREAVAAVERSPARLVRAQAHADLGLSLQRGSEAREHLTAALELADACGAQPLASRVRRALSRAGARPRRAARTGPASLTAAERRVADLAARGLTNHAIAEQLVVTVRTVELHLTNSYRKLGIGSRAALARALGDAA